MDPQELTGIESTLDGLHRRAHQVRCLPDVELDIVARRPDPVDLVGPDELDTAVRSDQQTSRSRGRPTRRIEDRPQPPFEVLWRRRVVGHHPVDGGAKRLAIERDRQHPEARGQSDDGQLGLGVQREQDAGRRQVRQRDQDLHRVEVLRRVTDE